MSGCLSRLEDTSQPLDTPPGTRSLVIQGLLDPRATSQTIWVEWSLPADSAEAGNRAVPPALVHLGLIGPDSIEVPFQPGSPGEFSAVTTVLPGSVYRLQGVVADSTITGSVRVPDSVRWIQPASDTVHLPRNQYSVALPYWVNASGASFFVLLDQHGFSRAFRSLSGTLEILAFDDTLRLRIQAFEPYAAEWVWALQDLPPSNISGALGYLGAFAESSMMVVIVE